MTAKQKLTWQQRAVLKTAIRAADRVSEYLVLDGNQERTARSLVKHGLARWDPPGTHANLVPTDEGRARMRS